MQADLWKALLRRVPAEQMDNLVLMTAQGTEINVQAVLRMEEHWMVLRGRLAGSNDGGRIFCLPYEHIDHAGFQRPLSDEQLQAIFGGAPAAPPPPPPEVSEAVAPAPAPPATPPPSAPPPPSSAPAQPGSSAPGMLARVPTRSKIIQRLRLRAEVIGGSKSPPKQ
jgi:hypothetical protein